MSITFATASAPDVRTPFDSLREFLLHASTLAVIGALVLRLSLLLVSHVAQDKYHVDLQIVGQEAACVASALATGKGFSNPFRGYEGPTAWLAPVFPALWSVGYRVFDPETSRGGIYFCQAMDCFFSALTCWPIYWLGTKLFGRTIGRSAAWAWAFLPLAILFPLEWTWNQSLSALILAVLLYATFWLREAAANSKAWSGYGLLWGFAALVNPTLCVVLPFLIGWVALSRNKTHTPYFRPLLRVGLLFVLTILPWIARNSFVMDEFVSIKSNFGLELWLGNNPDVPADDVYSHQLNPMVNHQQLLQLAFAGEPAYMRGKQHAALTFIRANPGTFAQLVARRVLDTWTAWYDSRIDKWVLAFHLSRIWIIFCTLFSLLAGIGLVLALRKNYFEVLPLAMCAILIPVPYYVTHSSLRYRHPIDPFLTLLATYAVAHIYRKFRHTSPSSAAAF